jgi:hypothetical protein
MSDLAVENPRQICVGALYIPQPVHRSAFSWLELGTWGYVGAFGITDSRFLSHC